MIRKGEEEGKKKENNKTNNKTRGEKRVTEGRERNDMHRNTAEKI